MCIRDRLHTDYRGDLAGAHDGEEPGGCVPALREIVSVQIRRLDQRHRTHAHRPVLLRDRRLDVYKRQEHSRLCGCKPSGPDTAKHDCREKERRKRFDKCFPYFRTRCSPVFRIISLFRDKINIYAQYQTPVSYTHLSETASSFVSKVRETNLE